MDLEIISAEELARRRSSENLVVLDVRRGERFAEGHVPGARNYSCYGINTYDTDPAPLVSFMKMWAFQLGLAGIHRDHEVVVYGERSDEGAARAAWFLDWLGHPRAALLDGGLEAWTARGGDLVTGASAPKSTSYVPSPVRERVATWQDVLVGIYDDDTVILDTRSDGEWFGSDTRGTARGGAVPGAVHQEWHAHLDEHGRFLPSEVLRERFEALGVTPDRQIIAYCNTGYRSAHAYVALGRLGYPRVRNYVGSWQEWANRPECPVVIPGAGERIAPR